MLGPETTSLSCLPRTPLAQALEGPLLLNFLVEGAFSPGPCLHPEPLPRAPPSTPTPIIPGSGSTSGLHPAAATGLRVVPIGAEALRVAATLPGIYGSGRSS